MSDLKQCPCGATPTKLAIGEGSTFRWRVVSGGCCGDWEVECRVPTVGPEANEEGALAACVREWNAMPRGWEARIAELEEIIERMCHADAIVITANEERLEAENQRLREAARDAVLEWREVIRGDFDGVTGGNTDDVTERLGALLGGGG